VVLTTKSRELIIAAAIDAMAHAVEAYVSRIAFPFTEFQSLKAIDLIIKYLPEALDSGSIEALEQLSIASSAAAMAFSNASLGLDHALAHSLGGMLDTIHGLIHPVMLPPVMRYNLPACEEKLADIGEIILGRRLRTSQLTALAAIERLEELCHGMDITSRLKDIVSDKAKLPQICEMALNDACLLTNPRPVALEDMLQICEEAW
jgi:alcohol dehydrogenase